jgi:hypothetical protein
MGKDRIRYRVVDEYNGDTLSEKRTRSSKRPLSLGELIVFLAAWPLQEVLEMNELDRDGAQDFTRPSSEVYPKLEAAIRARIDGWYMEWWRSYGIPQQITEREDRTNVSRGQSLNTSAIQKRGASIRQQRLRRTLADPRTRVLDHLRLRQDCGRLTAHDRRTVTHELLTQRDQCEVVARLPVAGSRCSITRQKCRRAECSGRERMTPRRA